MAQGLMYGALLTLAAAGAVVVLTAGDSVVPPATASDVTTDVSTQRPTTSASPSTTLPALVRPPTTAPGSSTTPPAPTTTSTAPPPPDGWRLVWSDEFEAFDHSHWDIEHSTYGHGNGELQCYQSQNVVVDNGMLHLIAQDAPTVCPRDEARNYSSGMVRSSGLANWTYGRFEVRARFPAGHGLWPAAWLSPTSNTYGSWPRSGELDIVESLGRSTDRIVGSLHWMGARGHELANREHFAPADTDFAEGFHTFTVEWEPDQIIWYVDGIEYHRVTDWASPVGERPAPFDQPFYLKLNLAVGGGAAGSPGDDTTFPASYDVDWVRVYQR